MNIQWKKLIPQLLLPLGVGALSAFITSGSMDIYSRIIAPPLAPPAILFPIVWTVLYLLMGVSAYLIIISGSENTENALFIYWLQLAVNFIWSPIFFNAQMFRVAFVVLILLWVLVFTMIRRFLPINKTAAYLQIPYLIWLTFAGYLNLAIAILN